MSSATRTDDDPLIGESIGGYQITALIGEGGMGRVYRAVLPSINAQVAIKVLSVEVASEPDIAERFVAEAKIANLVRHDGLVNVIGIGVVPDGRPYQIMELLHGATLAELIRARGRLPLGTTCVALCEALRALAALHAVGVVHRDVKSSNLFITTAGHVKVIDFGIAKLVAARGITQSGQTLGTPEYMAPEQLEATVIDERADLYSMGVVLFEAATGERPFKGRVLEALASRSTPPPAGGPHGLDDVIGTAMDPDRTHRYADAISMERALHAFAQTLSDDAFGPLADGPPLPRPTSLPTRDDLPRREAETQPSVQAMLGRYEVHGVIGKGAAGTVMAGFDPLIQRKVALKVLHPNKSHRDRLIREAQAMAKVADPNIVTLYELGDDGSRMFLAMELVDGTDLATWLHDRRPLHEIVRVFTAAGRGLVAAHAGGIVHRDFKPANVLIGRDGRPRVGDFGLALGQGGGTPAYMAPEQVDGHADERSDQFAFCASLWEAVHGELPFTGDSAMSLAISARSGAIRTPARSTPIDDILRRGLSAKARDRHASMVELLTLLDRAIAPRKSRWPWLGGGVAIAATTATIAVAWMHHGTPPDLELLREAKLARDPGSVLRALGRVPDSVLDSPEARQLAADAAAAGPTRDIAASSTITGIEVSQDGHRIALASRNEIAIHDLITGTATVLKVTGSATQLRLDDGAVVARIDDAVVKVPIDGTTPETLARCGHDDSFVMTGSQMITSSDLHFLACSELDGSVVTDTRTGHSIHTHDFVFDFGHGVDRLLVLHKDLLSVLDSRTGAVIGMHSTGDGLIATDGDLVVMAAGPKVTVWNPIEPSEHEFTARHDVKFLLVTRGPVPQIAVAAADGKTELYSVTGEPRGRLDLSGPLLGSDVPLDPSRNRFVFLTDGTISVNDFDIDRRLTLSTHAKGFAISGDGSIVLLAQGSIATVWFPDLRPPTHVAMPADALIAHSITRDGSVLAYADTDNVHTVDLVTGAREVSPVPDVSLASVVSFASDDSLGFIDAMHRVWAWRRGGPAELLGLFETPSRWMSLVDDTHAAVIDRDNHLHAVGGGRDGEPCGTDEVVGVYGRFAVLVTAAATVACDVRSGATHPLTSSLVKRVSMASEGDRALLVDNGRVRLFRLIDGFEEPLPATADIVDAHLDGLGRRALVIDKAGDAFIVERGGQHAVPLADCHLAMSPQISADGSRVAAVVDGHVRLWYVDRPAEPHDLGQLGPLPPAAISVAIGRDAVLTTSGGLDAHAGIKFVLDRWPASLPNTDSVRAWIRAVAP